MNISQQAKDRLVQQRRKYLGSLGVKKSRIADCWEQIQAGGWNVKRLNTLKTLVHRLAGSAGSYGLKDLGRAAQDLDRTLVMESEMSSLSPAVGQLIKDLLMEFDRVIESLPSPPSGLH